MTDEFEVVQHPQIDHLNLFLVTIDYRTQHLHNDFEIDLVLNGEALFVCQNETYTISSGNMILINPNQPHEIKTIGSSASILCLQITPLLFRSILPSFESIYFDTKLPFNFISNKRKKEVQMIFLKLAVNYFNKPACYEVLCMALLNLMIYSLLKYLPFHKVERNEQISTLKRVDRLNHIIQYVDENYTQKIRLSDLAQEQGLSLSYLSHFVKANLGLTFQDYVNKIRFNQARKLLLSDDNKHLLDISIESGFSDPRYLAKTFLKNTGLTPNEYRNQHKDISFKKNHHSLHSSEQRYSQNETLEILKKYSISNLEQIVFTL